MNKEQIKDFIRKQDSVTANLEKTSKSYWRYVCEINYGEGYKRLSFVVPIKKVDGGFCSNMPAKYLLNYLS